MNDYTDIVIATDDETPIKIASAYDVNGDISIIGWSSSIVSTFPFLAFLQEATEIIADSNIHILGVNISEIKHTKDLEVVDELGYFMIAESAQFQKRETPSSVEWNKLPLDLAWLYGDRPYMTSNDLIPISLDIRLAIETGTASQELVSYVETHTAAKPHSATAYSSYGMYFTNDMLVPHGSGSVVALKLGVEQIRSKENISFTQVGDTLTLADNDSTLLEIIIQDRIGDYMSSQSLYAEVNLPLSEINLTTAESPLYTKEEIEDTASFEVKLDMLYNMTSQLPIWAQTDTVKCDRKADIHILTSNQGILTTPSIELRTASQVLKNGEALGPISTNNVTLDDQILSIGPIFDSIIYAEYTVT